MGPSGCWGGFWAFRYKRRPGTPHGTGKNCPTWHLQGLSEATAPLPPPRLRGRSTSATVATMRFACLLAFTFGLIQASARPAAEGAGTSWHYAYDAAGQLQTVHEGADLRESFTDDFNGNLQVVGAMVSPEVDRRDRLLSFEGDESVVGYAYKDLGQRTMACKVICEGVAPWRLWEYTGHLIENRPFIVEPHPLGPGGGTDYIDSKEVPPEDILPAFPVRRN